MPETEFSAWLREALAGRANVYLVRGSGLKDNGRPVIDDSRVSKWLSGEQRPSIALALLAARVLGASPADALKAAGYDEVVSQALVTDSVGDYPDVRPVYVTDLDRLRALHAELGKVLASLESGEANQALQVARDRAVQAGMREMTKGGEERDSSASTSDSHLELVAAHDEEHPIEDEQGHDDHP